MNRTEDSSDKDRRHNGLLRKLILPLIIIIVIIILILLMRGTNRTSGSYPADVHTKAMSCVKDGQGYDKVYELNPESRNVKVDMIFEGTTTLQTISLKYTMNFASAERAEEARATASVTLAESLHDYGYDFGDFSNKLSALDSSLTVELFANKTELTTKSASFFMVKTNSKKALPATMEEFRKNYTDQGFTCESNA